VPELVLTAPGKTLATHSQQSETHTHTQCQWGDPWIGSAYL